MVRPQLRFQNCGRPKTTYNVNFEDSQSILDIIAPLMTADNEEANYQIGNRNF